MNLIRLTDLSVKDINQIFKIADDINNGEYKDFLKNKTAVLFFPSSSIRTRISYEKGVNDLGGHPILFPSDTLDKREKLEDVIGYIENWCDVVIIRHGDIGKIEEICKHSKIAVINAMTKDNHPCEILSDIYAIRKLRPNYLDLCYTFVGENANISKTYASIASILNLRFNHVCVEAERIKEDNKNYRFTSVLQDVVEETDVFLTDQLPPYYKNEEHYSKYQITTEILNSAKPDCLLNPCPPFCRGEEVSAEAINSSSFVGYEFKKSLLNVQQAIIVYCMLNS